MKNIVVTGSFDDLRSRQVRLLEEAAKYGRVHVLLWSGETIQRLTDKSAKFTQEERLYFVEAIRYVAQATIAPVTINPDTIPTTAGLQPDVWVIAEDEDTPQKLAFCADNQIVRHIVKNETLSQIPPISVQQPLPSASQKKVVVTGCFDWLHSGHVRFFEETAELGDLHVVLGHDENVRLLKGKGHPLFPENERQYMVQAIRHVKQALISTGRGWMDAAPEIDRIRPDIYAVNEDGDQPEKRSFCQKHKLEYVVLKRLPKEGLPKRESTALRGF